MDIRLTLRGDYNLPGKCEEAAPNLGPSIFVGSSVDLGRTIGQDNCKPGVRKQPLSALLMHSMTSRLDYISIKSGVRKPLQIWA